MLPGKELISKSAIDLIPCLTDIPVDVFKTKVVLIWSNMEEINEQDRAKIIIENMQRFHQLQFDSKPSLSLSFSSPLKFPKKTISNDEKSCNEIRQMVEQKVREVTSSSLLELKEFLLSQKELPMYFPIITSFSNIDL